MLQTSQENPCARVFFNKVAGLAKFQRTPLFYRTPLVVASRKKVVECWVSLV